MSKEVTPKSLLLKCLRLKASKQSVFSLTKVSASDVPAILKKYVLKEVTFEAAILKPSSQPGRVCVQMSFRLTQNFLKEKNLQHKLGILHKVSKLLSFFTSLSLQCYHFRMKHFWTKSVVRNDIMKAKPGFCVLFKITTMMFEFWASVETNFIRKACTLEAETSVTG